MIRNLFRTAGLLITASILPALLGGPDVPGRDRPSSILS